MKKFIFVTLAWVTLGSAMAQSTQTIHSTFETAMLKNMQQLDTVSTTPTFMQLSGAFERIGNTEKTKWQPFYYAAYCYTAMAYNAPDKKLIDPLTDKAEALLQQAENIEKNNSEISCLFAMINSCRILVDPMGRFQAKGKEVQELLTKAKSENEANPRIYLLQARMLLKTPEAFGGGKQNAKAAAEAAVEKFKIFKAEDALAPTWGEHQTMALLDKINSAK